MKICLQILKVKEILIIKTNIIYTSQLEQINPLIFSIKPNTRIPVF